MNSMQQRDQKLIWHPFTQEKTAAPVIAVTKAQGAYIYDENGKAYLDLISSWWVNLHGHAHPEIARKIYEQALQLEHVIFAGFTHSPAIELCENLSKILPQQLCKFFFSDNGSTAVEVALKMAYQYWQNQGEPQRSIFLSFEGGYHGDTFGAMSVGNKSGFHNTFSELFFKVLSLPYPATHDDDEEVQAKEAQALEILNMHLEKRAHQIAAIILEPLVQGASGMRVCRAEFIRQVIKLVRNFGILVIFDEVMTGFGRTGSNFALEQVGLEPDFLCLSKGITGGFLPLALTVTTQKVYDAFLSSKWQHAFAHGHSYTANPLACSAAIASLELLLKPETQQAIKQINETHIEGLEQLKSQGASKTRAIGTISAFDLPNIQDVQKLKAMFLAEGLLIRPLGNTVYLLPPYCTTKTELEEAYSKITKVLKSLEPNS